MTRHHDKMLPRSSDEPERLEDFLKKLRELLGISQQELSNRLGVGVTTVSRWERGISPMTLTVRQFKSLVSEMEKVGLTLKDLPDE